MFEKDWDMARNVANAIPTRHSFGERNDFINPYTETRKAQRRCSHMWENGTDAIYIIKGNKRKCAICGREF